ncbi:MAG TPA: type IV secretion system protein [Steroidobacter sp.]|nr:type IV secretion system protein [Steroidobacter sp.]
MAKDAQLETYWDEAASWDADRAAAAQRSARAAWCVAGGAGACATLSAAALFALLPLKRVEPFVIRVDNTTGLVDVVPVFVGNAEFPEAVTRYFLHHYVTVCERFNFSTAESDYEECGAFHSTARNQAWSAAWNRTNPNSPLNVYKDGTTIRAQATSISFFVRANGLNDLAQVRYIKSKRSGAGGEEQKSYWIATVQYVYAEPSKQARLRRWNPLGFKIVEFTVEQEVQSAPSGAGSGSALLSERAS